MIKSEIIIFPVATAATPLTAIQKVNNRTGFPDALAYLSLSFVLSYIRPCIST